ncbi:MAG TPA: sigma-70 family RNA polymerase sigma factor [Vicinamibacterales bacterium]|nr:sigma-70 family RNA polymerase sigma factor [Vicinamibacterales bacterium]
MQRTDADLAQDALAGSEAAYRELVTRYATPAVNFVHRIVRDRGLAEDLAQEGFLRVYQRLHTYDPDRKFSSWFFQVLRNITIDYLRVNRVPTASLDELQEEGNRGASVDRESVSPEEAAEQGELAIAMAAALSRIRPEYRECVVLRYQEGLTHPEIAEILGLPAGTVKTHLHRARKELADILAESGWKTNV